MLRILEFQPCLFRVASGLQKVYYFQFVYRGLVKAKLHLIVHSTNYNPLFLGIIFVNLNNGWSFLVCFCGYRTIRLDLRIDRVERIE